MTTEHALLRDLATLDPARDMAPPTPGEAHDLRRWVLAHDRAPTPEPTPLRRRPRRLALVGAAAAVAVGVAIAGVLPGVISGQGATAPAAAIPMLSYSEPQGIDAAAELEQLADHIRETA